MAKVNNLEYSAGAVSKGFWFQEFKKYNELLNKGFTDKDIKIKQQKENMVMASSESYGKRIINEVSKRARALPDNLRSMFFDLSVGDQKILNILGIMLTDILFFEYMYEVYREKIIIGKLEFDNSDTRIFFKNKSEQSDKVANFTVQTKNRLTGTYRTYLKEANLLIEENSISILRKPILDVHLENEMRSDDLYTFLRIFMGE